MAANALSQYDEFKDIDVVADAEKIMQGVDLIADEIQKRVIDARASGEKQPIFIFLGEDHSRPAHILHGIALMAVLMKRGVSFAYSHELENNYLSRIFQKYVSGPTEKLQEIWKNLAANDHDNSLSMHALIAFGASLNADHTLDNLRRFCIKNDIPTTLSDAAVDGEQRLDLGDESTLESVLSSLQTIPDDFLDSLHPDGIFVRNHHILKQAGNLAAKAEDVDVVLVQCGLGHIAGHEGAGWKTEQSLVGMCRERGLPYFAIPLVTDDDNEVNIYAYREILTGNAFLRRDLPVMRARYDPSTGQGHPLLDAHFSSRDVEAAYINAILKHPYFAKLGLDQLIQTPDQYEATSDKVREAIIPVLTGEEDSLPKLIK